MPNGERAFCFPFSSASAFSRRKLTIRISLGKGMSIMPWRVSLSPEGVICQLSRLPSEISGATNPALAAYAATWVRFSSCSLDRMFLMWVFTVFTEI
jgi:hypothetical protein